MHHLNSGGRSAKGEAVNTNIHWSSDTHTSTISSDGNILADDTEIYVCVGKFQMSRKQDLVFNIEHKFRKFFVIIL